MPGSDAQQPSFADVEYGNRRRRTRRDEFLAMMDEVIPWDEWTGLVVPFYPTMGRRGRQPVPVETMLRMYLLQVWFSLSDEGTEDAIYDSYAFRTFLGLDFTTSQVPDATTLLHFRHLIEEHDLGRAFLDAQTRFFEKHGWIMRGGTVVDATIINAPSSTKNAAGARDPEMHQTQKGNQWFFGFKAHTGVDAGTGYVHTVTVTAANEADILQAANLMRPDDRVGYADSGYQGVAKRPEIVGDADLAKIAWRVAARKSKLKAMPVFDQQLESRKGVGAGQGRAPVPDRQTRLQVHQDPVPRYRQEPQPDAGVVHLREPADARPSSPHSRGTRAVACPKPCQDPAGNRGIDQN